MVQANKVVIGGVKSFLQVWINPGDVVHNPQVVSSPSEGQGGHRISPYIPPSCFSPSGTVVLSRPSGSARVGLILAQHSASGVRVLREGKGCSYGCRDIPCLCVNKKSYK